MSEIWEKLQFKTMQLSFKYLTYYDHKMTMAYFHLKNISTLRMSWYGKTLKLYKKIE